MAPPPGRVPLNRALSKLGLLSRAQATEAILGGRVRVDGRVVCDPATRVTPERVRIRIDGALQTPARWRTLLFHKPRGVVTTRRDPQARTTVYDAIGEDARGLAPVGRLDLATSGLLLLTNDTRLAAWMTDPEHGVPRVYAATVRGAVTPDEVDALTAGVSSGGERLRATRVAVRKTSRRESHLVVELREGRNREIRRLFAAVGHEVTRLKRVRLGGLELGDLRPGQWRALAQEEVRAAFPDWPCAMIP